MFYLPKIREFLKKMSKKKVVVNKTQTFLETAYQEILNREIDPDGLKYFTSLLENGYSQTDVLMNLVKSEEYLNRVFQELRDGSLTISSSIYQDFLEDNQTFLKTAYQKLLGREIDLNGLNYYSSLLKNGTSKTKILMEIVKSEEFINKTLKENSFIENIRNIKADKYTIEKSIFEEETIVFNARGRDDFDWLEQMILEQGYYERPGCVWNFDIDIDKKLMAEILSKFKPDRCLEIGCANGAVIQCLDNLNIFCEGVEISKMAIQKAFPQIKKNIHQGDLLNLSFPTRYDLVFGLDIFEHLNPNKVDLYIEKIYQVLNNGCYLFCNIPAFGEDSIFGTIFPIYLKDWDKSVTEETIFSKIHCDENGYPMHGHLIWAHTQWWVKQFEKSGFQREIEIEKAFHQKYDEFMDKTSLARKAYYIFSKNADKNKNQSIINWVVYNHSELVIDVNFWSET